MDNNTLEDMRNKIDVLDCEISRLLEKRMNLVSKIADYKAKTNSVVLDKNREQTVIENILSVIANKDYSNAVKKIFQAILDYSKEYQIEKIALNTSNKFALIGEKLTHSVSPEIHNLIYQKMGTNASYELIEIAHSELDTLILRLKSEGYSGVNVTIPYKTDIMSLLESLSDEAKRIGAVNTIKIGEKITGFNTDYYGFDKALDFYGFNPSGKSCAVLGSGGASRAVVSLLEDKGAAGIAIVTRDTDSTSFKYPGLQSIEIDKFVATGFELIVNTTPVGMYPNNLYSPLKKEQLIGAHFIMDLIYNPLETLLLNYAGELGIKCANGLYMLVAQAICSEEIWHDIKVEKDIVNVIYKELQHKMRNMSSEV